MIDDIEVGDLVDVMLDHAYGVYKKIRVVELVDDVSAASGVDPDADNPNPWSGPGFRGKVEGENHDYEVGDELIFKLDEVVPGSKDQYYVVEEGKES